MQERLLKVEEAARQINLSRSKTYELVHSGELPAIRIGNRLRIPLAALDAWIAAQLETSLKA